MRKQSSAEDIKQHLTQKIQKLADAQRVAAVAGVAAMAMGIASFGVATTVGTISHFSMEKSKASIVNGESYQQFVSSDVDKLMADFSAGNISYTEFKTAYDKLYSFDHLKKYAEVSEDHSDNVLVTNYENSVDFSNNMLGRATPICCGAGVVSLMGAEVLKEMEKATKRKLENANDQDELELEN